jgi:hypothetical protein
MDRHADYEALKQLKARYCRLLDNKNWEAWRQLFTDDFLSDTTGSGGEIVRGGDEFVAYVRRNLAPRYRKTVHQVHAPELTLTSESTAEGTWALEDFVRFMPGLSVRGYGHYIETYEKVANEWRFKTSKLTRLRGDIHTPILSFCIPGWGIASD